MKTSHSTCSNLWPQLLGLAVPLWVHWIQRRLGTQAGGARNPVARTLQPLPQRCWRQRACDRGNEIAGEPILRVAVAGAGAFGRNHLRVYRELEAAGLGVVLVAAIEPDAARAVDTASNTTFPCLRRWINCSPPILSSMRPPLPFPPCTTTLWRRRSWMQAWTCLSRSRWLHRLTRPTICWHVPKWANAFCSPAIWSASIQPFWPSSQNCAAHVL